MLNEDAWLNQRTRMRKRRPCSPFSDCVRAATLPSAPYMQPWNEDCQQTARVRTNQLFHTGIILHLKHTCQSSPSQCKDASPHQRPASISQPVVSICLRGTGGKEHITFMSGRDLKMPHTELYVSFIILHIKLVASV